MAGNRTIPRLWRDAVARNTGTAYLVDEGESWREVSWREAAERVDGWALPGGHYIPEEQPRALLDAALPFLLENA